ncbi:hypothetical protein ACXR2U_06455 [Jatrophihabitans sp. YIM 134969]
MTTTPERPAPAPTARIGDRGVEDAAAAVAAAEAQFDAALARGAWMTELRELDARVADAVRAHRAAVRRSRDPRSPGD